jgi:transposase-like protein
MKPYKDWLIEQIINGNILKDSFEEELTIREKEKKELELLHKNKLCPNCNRFRLFYRRTFNNWRCNNCKSFFSYEMNFLGTDN